MAGIAFERVGKVYDDGTRAVQELTLDVGDGEFLVFVGPSGCGKTTALRMVAGLEEITEGVIRIGERIVNDLEPRERDIAMVFQNYALYPHMDVYQNIAFGLRMRKVPKAEQRPRVEEVARILGLKDYLKRKPKQLSGGQRQRVAMGRAIVREPSVFLMDEPLSNLDAKLRVQMRAEISRIQREVGVTTVYVTHDQVEAMTMGDRVAVMRRGELQQLAPPQKLYDSPVNLFVASFIGSPQMNLLEAEIQRRGDSLVARFGNQELEIPDAVTGRRPALAGYAGRSVALGIRPEHMEDASIESDGRPTLLGRVRLTEALGSELLAHVEIDGKTVVREEVLEGVIVEAEEAAVAEDLMTHGADARQTTIVGRFDAGSRVKPDEEVEVSVETERLQFFDLDTGFAIQESAVAG
jgi:multiple sugar transport system ATP-binding protein